MSVSKEQLREWWERWEKIRDNPGKYRQMGPNPEFIALKEECAEKGYKPCASRACRNPVQRTTGFFTHNKSNDKLSSRCKMCANGVGAKEASAASCKRKRERNDEVDATVAREPNGNVEDEAVANCLVPLMRSLRRETHVNIEFRRADMGARPRERSAERGDEYMQIQVKADGAYKKDGTTVKPNNSKQREGGGRACFAQCKGYSDMAMMLVKTREVEEEGEKQLVRKLWIADGASVEASVANQKGINGTLTENADGSLGPDRLPAYDPDDPDDRDAIDAKLRELDAAARAKGHLRTIEQMWYDIPHKEHRKEATLYLALRAAGLDLHMPEGNSHVYDCVETMQDGTERKIQLKTYNLEQGCATMYHCVNGVRSRPYSEEDDIDDVIIGAIVTPDKDDDPYRLVYARFDKDALLKNGVFRHKGYRGRQASQGKQVLSMPKEGIYHKWLHSMEGYAHPNNNNKWLLASRYGWHRPVEIDPEAAGIPLKWLEDAAQEAGNPKAFPSEEAMDLNEKRMEQWVQKAEKLTERMEHAAEDAKKAALEAKQHADRAEAAKAGPSTVNVTNNITNNFNFAEPPAPKKLKQM
jgi:hypothetical protein